MEVSRGGGRVTTSGASGSCGARECRGRGISLGNSHVCFGSVIGYASCHVRVPGRAPCPHDRDLSRSGRVPCPRAPGRPCAGRRGRARTRGAGGRAGRAPSRPRSAAARCSARAPTRRALRVACPQFSLILLIFHE